MHLSIEVVREPSIVVQPAQVRATDIADLEFLVARGTARVGQGLELALAVASDLLGLAQLEVLRHCEVDAAGGAEDFDLLEARAYGFGEVVYLFELRVVRQYMQLIVVSSGVVGMKTGSSRGYSFA